jgi:hypothetical protein
MSAIMTTPLTDGIDVEGDDQIVLLIDHETRGVVGVAVTEDDDPRWWRGVYRKRERRLFVPDDVEEPGLDAARRLVE